MDRVLLRSVKPALHANTDCTPLIAAVVSRQVSMVKYLLEVMICSHIFICNADATSSRFFVPNFVRDQNFLPDLYIFQVFHGIVSEFRDDPDICICFLVSVQS